MAASVAQCRLASGSTSLAAPRRAPTQRRVVVRPRAAAAPTQEAAAAPTQSLVDTIKRAAGEPRSVPGPQVLQSMLALEKAKVPPAGWEDIATAKGTHWRLVMLANKDSVKAGMKGDSSKGTYYWPLVAAQNFDAAKKEFENGVFIGNLGYLTFTGPFLFFERMVTFDVTRMKVGMGPWEFSFQLKAESPLDNLPEDKQQAAIAAKKAGLPFFLYSWVDKDIIVARGRGGGLAVWTKADSDWAAENGVLKQYADK